LDECIYFVIHTKAWTQYKTRKTTKGWINIEN